MNKFAQVKNSVVVALFEKAPGYDLLFDQKNVIMIDCTHLKITPEKGWNYDSNSNTFSPPTEDQKMTPVRSKRNRLLASSDKYMLSDIYNKMQPALQAQWQKYRQALRDIPQKYDPDKVIWPTPPSM